MILILCAFLKFFIFGDVTENKTESKTDRRVLSRVPLLSDVRHLLTIVTQKTVFRVTCTSTSHNLVNSVQDGI